MSCATLRVVSSVLLALALVLLLPACGTMLTPSASVALDAAYILERVNEARATTTDCGTAGVFPPVPPLAMESRLTAAAQQHALDMQGRGFISHTGSDGSDVGERIERQGYAWSSWGENVASGFRTADSVMDAWLASPGHCANIMRERYTEIGIGRAGLYWSQVFARPQ